MLLYGMANCDIYHDTRRSKNDGTFPIKIRVTHERVTKYYETVFSITETEYSKIFLGKRLNADQKKTKTKVNSLIEKAESIIEDLEIFSFEIFKRRFLNTGDRLDLIFLIREKANELYENEYFPNARLYKQAANLLEKYNLSKYHSSVLKISSFTPDYLKDFQTWALSTCYIIDKNKSVKSNKYSVTTINMYLTRVKAVINSLIETGELHRNKSPFGRKKFLIPKSNNTKRPLEKHEIMAIMNYQPENDNWIFSKDLFIFSYLANGMNFTDILQLKWSDIKGDSFYFVRQKTSSKLPDKKIRVYLDKDLEEIFTKHGSHKLGNEYIFNVIPWRADKKTQEKIIRSTISKVNLHLKQIAAILGINSDISTYFARHTFVTIMHEYGASDYTIKEIVGHEDIKSTQSYMGAEKKEKIMDLRRKLLYD